ncbi:arginyl-tRNA synthetase [Setomelanomma holmii]|uniref:arginine--tRNA ligase n=1 Tax=Setomelanomma holmii TaxID=210430 RepID=A0A9P4HIQ8_9PLEO|nr:arginyl-tRNA synthetase [Setomelanomma holmii]
MDVLEQTLAALGLETPIPNVEVSKALANPLNLYRAYLERVLTEISGCDHETATKSIQWPNNIDNGDLSIVLPKLRPRAKAQEVAFELMDKGKHLRSTIIGAFLARLYDSMGWAVTRMNFLGDWGKPIALLYVGWQRFGSEAAFEADAVGHLLDVYHKIDELFQPEQAASKQARDEAVKEGRDESEAQQEIESKGIFTERNGASKKLEDGDDEVNRFWSRVREVVIADYQSFYDTLGIRFDDYSGESEVRAETMAEVEQMLKDKNISEESAGAWMVDMTKLGSKAGHAIIRDRSGSSMYLLRDLAAVIERSRKYSFDKMIYVVASDNSVHFTQMFKILEALDKELADKLHHVKFSEVSKMGATLGKGYKPSFIFDKCEEAMSSLSEVDADKAALMGRSGPITRALGHTVTTALSDQEFEVLAEDDKANLLRILAQYPEVVNAAFNSLETSGIVTYFASVTEQVSDCLDEEDGEVAITSGFAALLEATRIVLKNGMTLLGLKPVTELPQERADTPVAG